VSAATYVVFVIEWRGAAQPGGRNTALNARDLDSVPLDRRRALAHLEVEELRCAAAEQNGLVSDDGMANESEWARRRSAAPH
jgi:hypothetical protein